MISNSAAERRAPDTARYRRARTAPKRKTPRRCRTHMLAIRLICFLSCYPDRVDLHPMAISVGHSAFDAPSFARTAQSRRVFAPLSRQSALLDCARLERMVDSIEMASSSVDLPLALRPTSTIPSDGIDSSRERYRRNSVRRNHARFTTIPERRTAQNRCYCAPMTIGMMTCV